jgi:hypothetical protein
LPSALIYFRFLINLRSAVRSSQEYFMPSHHDGPQSPYFKPLSFKGNANLPELKHPPLTEEMFTALKHASSGSCTAWGIPFQVNEVILLDLEPVKIDLPPTRARWLVFLHTSDTRPFLQDEHGFTSPMRGFGQLNEHAADYVICYEDGTELVQSIRRRHQIGDFKRHWGENCFQAVAGHKPQPVRSAHEQLKEGWGWSQTRVNTADSGEWVNWLWAWENPHPDKAITGLCFEPVAGLVILSALTAGEVIEHPLRWRTRRKARLTLPPWELFKPELDDRGLLKQIQLDLGQVISASPRLIYPDEIWEETYNNQIPGLSTSEVLVEYTSHPQACFSLWDGRSIPVEGVEYRSVGETLHPVASAEQNVRLRVVERAGSQPVAVKLHAHGEWGEYLAPVDRHRILNPAWFEDYSVDFAHLDFHQPEQVHACTYINGDTTLKLPRGKVYLEVSKGFEIRPIRKIFDVKPETEEILIELERVLPWRSKGWVTADTHVHFLSPMSALLEGAAEGVNVVNLLASQWGELMTNVGDFDGKTTWGSKQAGGDGEYLVRVGTENRQHVMGHISLLGYQGRIIAPMTTGGPDESALGDPIEVLLTEWARQCKQQDGIVVLPHFPNPRLEHAASIVSGDIDAVEMTAWEDLYEGIDPYSLSDWYRYLNCGYLLPAVGGTDKMTAATAVGTVRTYAHLDADQPFDYESWKSAIRRAETFVTYGPLLEFSVDGKPMGSRIEMSASGGTVDILWQAASVTVPMSRVELVVNGEIRQSQGVSPWETGGHWTLKVEKSSWLALLVRGHYADRPEIITAHTTPVMVRLAGSPMLAAADAITILEQIEGALAYLDTVGTRAEDLVYKRMRLVLEAAHRQLHNRMHQAGHFHGHTSPEDHH